MTAGIRGRARGTLFRLMQQEYNKKRGGKEGGEEADRGACAAAATKLYGFSVSFLSKLISLYLLPRMNREGWTQGGGG